MGSTPIDNEVFTNNDEIVGIEITPSFDYFSHIWHPLIRDCYGAAMIKAAKSDIKDSFSNSKNLDLSKCNTLKEVIFEINDEYLKSQANVYLKLMQIGELEFENKVEDKDSIRKNPFIKQNSRYFDYKIMLDKDKRYGTEIFTKDNEVVYLSLIKN